ncbi:MAG: hypothetical protein GY757_44980, partial [bacterium]|nr:hypothetical protein [bacterium]
MFITIIVVLGGDLVRSTEHIGIGILAACLRQNGYKVRITEIIDSSDAGILDEIAADGSSLVGFNTSCVNMSEVLKTAEKVKQRFPDIHITLGGHMATFWGEKILVKNPSIDSIVYGEGDITLVELVRAIEKKTTLAPIEGLIFRGSDEGITVNPKRPLIPDLDVLPMPDRDQFEMHNQDFQYLRISTSRGCFGNCGFCSSFVGRKQPGKRWRGRSPQLVVDEVQQLVNKYNFHTFDFVDSGFEDPGMEGKERIKKISQDIIARGLEIYYNCCFRAEDWKRNDYDRQLLELL